MAGPISRAESRARRQIDAQRAEADAAIIESTRADAFVQQFVGMSPAQIEAWIDANVTSLSQTRMLLKKLSIMLLLLARERYR